jgi:hypothetical protein
MHSIYDLRAKQMEIATKASETGIRRILDGLAEAYCESEDRAEHSSLRAQYNAILAIANYRFENFMGRWADERSAAMEAETDVTDWDNIDGGTRP